MANIALLSSNLMYDDIQHSTVANVQLFETINPLITHIVSNEVNLIILDVDSICYMKCGIYNIIHMLTTINQLTQSKTLLAVLLDNSISLNELKNILDCEINGVIPKVSWLGSYETETALIALLDSNNYKPKSLLAKFKQTHKHSNPDLTHRQDQICKMICKQGMSNKTIARQLQIAESTVKVHITEIFKKLKVRNRTQLAAFMKY